MRWNNKPNKPGIWRIVTKFAFLPVRVDLPNSDTVVWLERYKVEQRLKQFPHIASEHRVYFTKWVTETKATYEYWTDVKKDEEIT